MRFNSTTTKQGIIQFCENYCGFDDGDISGNPTLLKKFTGFINARYRDVALWAWRNQAGWQFDDSNAATLPIAVTDLVDGQQDYELPSTAFDIQRVEVKNSNGDYQQLEKMDWSQVEGTAMSEFYETNGMPVYYDLVGRSLMLYPAPSEEDVTLTEGLKIYVNRDITPFNSTATSMEPGLDEPFHILLPLGGSLDYCLGKGMLNRVNFLRGEISLVKKNLEAFYAQRDKQGRARLEPSRSDFI